MARIDEPRQPGVANRSSKGAGDRPVAGSIRRTDGPLPEDGRIRFVRALRAGMGNAGAAWTAEELVHGLDETPIVIAMGDATASTYHAQVAALTAVNLVGRLFRRLILVVPDGTPVDFRVPFIEGTLGPALVGFARRVSGAVQAELASAPPPGSVVLHIADAPSSMAIERGGPARLKAERPRKRAESESHSDRDVYCSGAGWLAQIGRRPTQPLASAPELANPIGPLVAAALGAAEVFKVVLGDAIAGAENGADGDPVGAVAGLEPINDTLTYSALTYEVGGTDLGPPLNQVVRLPATTLIGAGSIGSAFLWGLAHLRSAQGQLAVVDHDHLATHNPDRAILVLDDAAARELPKATWARDMVQPWIPDVSVEPFDGTLRAYIDTLSEDYTLPLAISAVDSVESRRDIQDALPRRVLNASTGPASVEITRHAGFGSDDEACLYCLYLPEVLERAPIQIAMARTGFPQREVAEFLMPDAPRALSAANVRGIEYHNGLSAGTLHAYVGRRLSDLLDDQIWYSQAPISLGGGRAALVTTAFVSAFAGFLLLAEALKEADPGLASYRLRSVYEQNLLGVPNSFQYRSQQDTTGYCLCHDPLRKKLYSEKYYA